MRFLQLESLTRSRRVQRWAAAVLSVTLVALTLTAVLGSWRQAAIVEDVAADSAKTDAYQQAAYLNAVEIGMLQGSLREPDGEERLALPATGREATAAMAAMAAIGGDSGAQLAQRRRAIQPTIDRYARLLDTGSMDAAQDLLETVIEPSFTRAGAELLVERQHHLAQHAETLAQARRDSSQARFGTVFAFLVGLVVLMIIGRLTRSHRAVVERMAACDALTGLPNRAAFTAHAERAVDKAASAAFPPAVLIMDLDGFKDVNDSLGHHIGDLLLVEVGTRLRAAVRSQDVVARLGGDEFAVLLCDVPPSASEETAVRIAEELNRTFLVDGLALDIEVSIGIASLEPGQDVPTLVRHADTAMYSAKQHRLGHARFDPDQAHDTTARLTLLGNLRRALETPGEIELHYQPKIAMDTGELVGAEALTRWRHPIKGPISPGEFIPVLEGTSLIHRFTAYVLDMALAQVRSWLDGGHRIPVAVNVSTRSLLDPGFPDTVARALHRAGVDGALLCLEITENTVMTDPERAIETLRRIRSLGVRTSIDDFGTGYSSMAYLKVLPVDEIKVDRSFVMDMASDHSNHALVESTVELGHNLGLTVVAEGVEDDATVAELHRLGCDIAQGYHFARPLHPTDFTVFLDGHLTARPRQPEKHTA